MGQFTLATVIDRFGWFGIQAVPLQWTRVLGLALLAVGRGADAEALTGPSPRGVTVSNG